MVSARPNGGNFSVNLWIVEILKSTVLESSSNCYDLSGVCMDIFDDCPRPNYVISTTDCDKKNSKKCCVLGFLLKIRKSD